MNAPATPHHRLLTTARTLHPALCDADAARLLDAPLVDPNQLRAVLAGTLEVAADRVVVTGTLDRRLIALHPTGDPLWRLADLSGQPHRTRDWPSWAQHGIQLTRPDRWLSPAAVDGQAVRRLTTSRVLLVALYHPEHFPLPRFPLAISDLARAARATLTGTVELLDMQLGVTLDDVLAAVDRQAPDILGVSATFGQHDLLTALLDHVTAKPRPPLLVAGGSLTARNERLLLDRYPTLLIARGAGEPTIADVIAHWHGELPIDAIRGIGYHAAVRGAGTRHGRRRTASLPNRQQTDPFPELDLLPATFARHGVAQLEVSRGCTNTCSFCPRSHKGTWAGLAADRLEWILHALGEVFDAHPHVSRTLYLVDEEFIGRGPDAVARALAVADTLHRAGFRWETSCRIDQVVRPDLDRVWHVDRAAMWRGLVDRGLRRCLFGVESGVTSILTRFNKETTGEQNALAIRTLSALGVPTRFTYITFDQLMTEAELRATHAFQDRRDLLLRPLPHLTVEQIVDGVHDPDFVADHATGQPFHQAISYPMVSMECLIGAAYTRQVTAAGLAGPERPSMGRVDADFADWRIGVCSDAAQRWIDRNFALDYTLKSLEKLLDGPPRTRVRQARTVLKDAAHHLLGRMLDLLAAHHPDGRDAALATQIHAAMDEELDGLDDRLHRTVDDLARALPPASADLLRVEHRRWVQRDGWGLINAADPCGT